MRQCGVTTLPCSDLTRRSCLWYNQVMSLGLTARRLLRCGRKVRNADLPRIDTHERKGGTMAKPKETTAPNPSVGADGGQSSKTYIFTIAETEAECNENFAQSQAFSQMIAEELPFDVSRIPPRDDARRCDDKIPTPKNIVATVAHRRGWNCPACREWPSDLE